MNVFSKITFSELKKNRTRTIVTIIGVILSVAMITAVTTLISSMQNYMMQSTIKTTGEWHVKFTDVSPEYVETVRDKSEIKEVFTAQNIGYALLDGGENKSKPYLFVTAFDDASLKNLPTTLVDGRMPENENELLISAHIADNGGVTYKVGDKLTLDIGARSINDEELGQNNPLLFEGESAVVAETFKKNFQKEYTIVGICERPRFEDYSAPGYTVITKADNTALTDKSKIDVYVNLKNPSKVYKFTEKIAGSNKYVYNSDLLRFNGISSSDSYNVVLFGLASILIVLIVTGSVLLIHNSFSISVSQRTRQFGLLSSIGATKKQLKKSVLFEGAFIGIIGIPLGVLAGIGGIGLTLLFVNDLFKSMSSQDVDLTLSVSVVAIVVAVLIGIITIFISAYIPAKKAAKLSAIDAIRQTADVKINPKKVKTSKLVQKLFGLEGTLALKNFKRNKKQYRSTVISLFVSVVLFISASAFGTYLNRGVSGTFNESGYDIMYAAYSNSNIKVDQTALYEKLKNSPEVNNSSFYESVYLTCTVDKSLLTDRYIKQFPKDIDGNTANVAFNMYFVDDETFEKYLDELKLNSKDYTDESSLIAVSKLSFFDPASDKVLSFDYLKRETPLTLSVYDPINSEQDSPPTKDITITHFTDNMPEIMSESTGVGFAVFARYELIENDFFKNNENRSGARFTFSTSDHKSAAKEISKSLKESGILSGYSLYNRAEAQESNRNFLLIINVFSYGFIILISLITIANVFNTISTNINLRRREFAMLKSVGMTNKGFNRMMRFECVFYGLKGLMYGLPVSVFVAYLIHKSVSAGVEMPFTLPWLSIGISVFSVFFVVFVTMIYSMKKIKKENTLDALKLHN